MDKFNLLIIDDDEVFLQLLRYMLEDVDRTDYHIETRTSYESGLEALSDSNWDACLLDYNLDTTNGLQLLEKLKTASLSYPIILMTGKSNPDTDIKALEAGAADFLSKDNLDGNVIDRCIRYAIKAKSAEHQLAKLAMTDPLSGLANRSKFHQALNEYYDRAKRNNSKLALLYIDIDHFKQINDSFGHHGGDMVIKSMANLLLSNTRSTDLVARLSGDEFAIILDNIAESTDAAKIAAKIVDDCAEHPMSYPVGVQPKVSIGIASYPGDTSSPDELLKAADSAMYEAKRVGRNGYQFFSSSLQKKAIENADIEQALMQAIDRDEFHLLYQPKIHANTQQCVGAEALIRWQRKDGKKVFPDKFIPIAEQTGIIESIGAWVIRRACLDIIEHHKLHQLTHDQSFAVNVSTRQLTSNKPFSKTLEAILVDTGYPSDKLEIEITETALAYDQRIVMRELSAIRELGVRISLDDFGTGYSSLSNLVQLPIDCLKVDRSFVSECLRSSKHARIVESVCSLAKSLGMTIVAEGIEDKETVAFLKALQCDLLQGYYYSRPIQKTEYFAGFSTLKPIQMRSQEYG